MGVASGDESKTLVVGRPNVVDAKGFLEDVEVILSSRLLTNNGPFAIQLEEAAREYLGAAHVVAVSNATMGLELALRALGLRPGSEVLVPSFTFVATAHAIVAADELHALDRERVGLEGVRMSALEMAPHTKLHPHRETAEQVSKFRCLCLPESTT